MINDELTKKLAQAAMGIMAEDNTNNKSDDGEGLDKVQPKAVKKKFADRKDKDIDNDGDVDSSDEYLHKRRKAISKAMKKEGYHEGMPKTKGDMLNAMYGQLKNMKKDDLMAAYDKIMSSYHKDEQKEETELDEATELYKKGKITLTKFMMGRGKGAGLQINYGPKFIQVPEKDIKQLFEAMVYITRSVPQFKESVELEEGKFDKLQKKLGRINPETLSDVMDGKIKLNSAEKKEFDEFMKGVRRMFGEMYDPEKDHTKDPKSHVKLNKETGMYCVYDMKGKKHAEFKTKEEAEAYSIKHHDKLMNK